MPTAADNPQRMIQTTRYSTKKPLQLALTNRLWVLLGSNHDVYIRDMLVTNPTSVLLLSRCWPSVGSLNFSSLRIQFSAEKWNLIKHALSYQLMLKYHVFWTPSIVGVQCCIGFKVGKIYCGGSCLLHDYPLREVTVHRKLCTFSLGPGKAILEDSLAKHFPSLPHIGFSLKKKIFLKNQCFVNNREHAILSWEL